MAKRPPKPKPEEATGQTKPDAPPPPEAAASTGAAGAAPVTQTTTAPTTELASAGTVGQAAAGIGHGVLSPPAAVNEPAPLPEAKPVTVIVTGPKAGRWRAKRFFTAEPTSINLTDLTETELALIKGDPLLTVDVVDAPH